MIVKYLDGIRPPRTAEDKRLNALFDSLPSHGYIYADKAQILIYDAMNASQSRIITETTSGLTNKHGRDTMYPRSQNKQEKEAKP